MMNDYDFLFVSPSFMQGFVSAVDMGGTLFELDMSEETDTRAIGNDWAMVGKDIMNAAGGLANQ